MSIDKEHAVASAALATATMNQRDLDLLIEHYLGMWHEPDPATRREIVLALFAPDAVSFSPRITARGHDEIVARVARSYDAFVAHGYVFRAAAAASAHHELVRFVWEMVPKAGGSVEARGLDIFVLRGAGRIHALYQGTAPAGA